MDALHEIEIAIILFLQSVGGWSADIMELVSSLGREEFYLVFMPALYWSFQGTLGLRVAVMLLLSSATNSIFKHGFHSPRPYWIDAQVMAYSEETSFGLPSAHAQNAASIWGMITLAMNKTWAKVVLVILIFLIGFSRIVLGMHFISDVAVGWVLGALVLFGFVAVEAPLTRWLKTLNLKQWVGLALLSALVIMGAILLSEAAWGNWQLPQTWYDTALAATPEAPIDPLTVDDAFTFSGTWFGMLAGAAWLYHRQGGFNASGTPMQRILRFLVGLVGVVLLWFVLGQVFPREQDAVSFALRFLRYTLIGLWVSAIAPVLFEVMGLCGSQKISTPVGS